MAVRQSRRRASHGAHGDGELLKTHTGIVGIANPPPEGGVDSAHELLLLERIVDGDREAFRSLYLAYHKRLSRFLMRFLRRHDLIEEVINDTLYAVWCKAVDFRGDSQLSTWIFGIAYRKALKAVRKESRDPPVDAAPESEAPVPLQDAEARQRELRQCLDLALASLPAPQRVGHRAGVFRRPFLRGDRRHHDHPVNTVKTRLFHARQRLRELLPELDHGDLR